MTLHLYYARWRAIVLLLLLVPFGAYNLLLTVMMRYVIGELAWVMVLPLAGLYIWGVWRLAKRLRHRGPVVTIDARGLIDHRVSERLIPWLGIRRMYIGPWGATTALLIAFKTGDDLAQAAGGPVFMDGLLTQAEYFINAPGAQWGVPLGPLRCSTSKVLAVCEKLHALAHLNASRAQHNT